MSHWMKTNIGLVKRKTKKVSPTILPTFCLVAFSGQHSGRRNLRRSWSQWVEEAEIRVCRGWGVTGVCIVKGQRGEGYAGKESQRYAWGPLVLWNTKWVMQKGKKSMRLRKEWHGICMLKIPTVHPGLGDVQLSTSQSELNNWNIQESPLKAHSLAVEWNHPWSKGSARFALTQL